MSRTLDLILFEDEFYAVNKQKSIDEGWVMAFYHSMSKGPLTEILWKQKELDFPFSYYVILASTKNLDGLPLILKSQIFPPEEDLTKEGIQGILENNIEIDFERNEFTGNDHPYINGIEYTADIISEAIRFNNREAKRFTEEDLIKFGKFCRENDTAKLSNTEELLKKWLSITNHIPNTITLEIDHASDSLKVDNGYVIIMNTAFVDKKAFPKTIVWEEPNNNTNN